MELPAIKAAFVGFGEVNTPRELIEKKCTAAREALEKMGMELIVTPPVSDDPEGRDVSRARADLAGKECDLLVICIAGWIPSHAVVDVISPFAHKPLVLWGLTGYYKNERLITTADQAGTSALRDTLDALGFKYRYVFDTPDAPTGGAEKVKAFGVVARAASLLRNSRVGMMGYRDMKLYATLADGVSLRRVVGTEIEIIDSLEVAKRMTKQEAAEIERVAADVLPVWQSDKPITRQVLEPPIRLYLAIMEQVKLRNYQAISLVDVDGVKKNLGFPPAATFMLLTDRAGLAAIPENDSLGAVTQLMVRFLTGQSAPYFEFYEFFTQRLLIGVPDFVPSAVVEGPVKVQVTKFGQLSEGILNVSRVKGGKVTLCRLAARGDRYRLHIVTGDAVQPRPWEEAGWTPPAPQLPSLEVALETPVEDFAQKVCGQHYILSYGNISKTLKDLCFLLGIEVI